MSKNPRKIYFGGPPNTITPTHLTDSEGMPIFPDKNIQYLRVDISLYINELQEIYFLTDNDIITALKSPLTASRTDLGDIN